MIKKEIYMPITPEQKKFISIFLQIVENDYSDISNSTSFILDNVHKF